jgi:hypothetical protein
MLASSRCTDARLVPSGELKVVGIGTGRRVAVA